MPNITIKKIVVFFTQNMFGKHLNDDDDDFTFISLDYLLLPYYLIFYTYFIFIYIMNIIINKLFIKVINYI